jgi:hypothetical protein
MFTYVTHNGVTYVAQIVQCARGAPQFPGDKKYSRSPFFVAAIYREGPPYVGPADACVGIFKQIYPRPRKSFVNDRDIMAGWTLTPLQAKIAKLFHDEAAAIQEHKRNAKRRNKAQNASDAV